MTKCAALPPCACRQGGSLLRVWGWNAAAFFRKPRAFRAELRGVFQKACRLRLFRGWCSMISSRRRLRSMCV